MNSLTSAFRHEGPFSETEKTEVVRELDRVLSSSWFRSSKRCSTLLRFLIEETLQEHTDQLRERRIAVDVFHRGPDYSSDADPVVRVAASEVRKRLAQYYGDPGSASQLRLELPVGSYIPVFRFPLAADPAGLQPVSDPAPPPAESTEKVSDINLVLSREAAPHAVHPHRRARRLLWPALAFALVFFAAIGMTWIRSRPRLLPSGFDAFWSPVIAAKESPLISIGEFRATQVEFVPNSARDHLDKAWMLGRGGNIPSGIKALIFANSISSTRIAMFLGKNDKQVELRPESETDYADVWKRPVILIGPYDNDWTIRLTDSMRFRFAIDFKQKTQWISDREKPAERIGMRSYSDYLPKTFEDFAVVARAINASTGHPAIILAGLSPLGTTSATEFVTNPKYLIDFARQAPPGWEYKNIEFLLATNCVDDVAGPPRIVAYSVW